ncbi:hypothetical protein LTR78_003253 [Recurvomyces mirabilis]|uniref:Uncharacterized protein n=1 Tax=Recurvomyces mirabilis TaxID=574656 RepID=A0AAE0WSJ7_9PEZI|nr:hypothetical protein LTR78_003253 [Recurvomyces mirabilis]KAK5156930.1 hypothetical protein LTS14_004447 [Recurvomyces mirabilis]
MADEYDYDVDEFDYGDGWMYVEDEFGLADELAEGQIPDPGYSGTNNEIEMDEYEYDFFDYWIDAEYGDDPYWDHGDQRSGTAASPEKSGQKRKRSAPAKPSVVDKRRKTSGKQQQQSIPVPPGGVVDNVVFLSQNERYRRSTAKPAPGNHLKRYGLLPDWETRFADADGEVKIVDMPVDMMQAAEATADETPTNIRALSAEVLDGDEDGEGWEDEGEDAEIEGGSGLELDPEMLKTILRQRLGEAGLEGMDEGAFMASISKLLSGEAADDDATAHLADMLLGKAASGGGGDSAVSSWLSQQGVTLEEDDDDTSSVAASSVATAGLPGPSTMLSVKRNAIMSPPDSGVSGLDSSSQTAVASKEMPLHSGSPKAQHMKPPRKKVSFDVPRTEEEDEELDDGDEASMTLPTSQHGVPKVAVTAARAVQSKVASARAKAAVKDRATPGDQLQDELAVEADVVVAPIRQTRKRKAANESDIASDVAELGKRAVKEPATRKTRSARARSGK